VTSAHIKGLHPEGLYTIRVVTRGSNGEVAAESPTVQISTRAQLSVKAFVLPILFVLLLMLLAFVLWQRIERGRAWQGV
jgi:hypothetical protein